MESGVFAPRVLRGRRPLFLLGQHISEPYHLLVKWTPARRTGRIARSALRRKQLRLGRLKRQMSVGTKGRVLPYSQTTLRPPMSAIMINAIHSQPTLSATTRKLTTLAAVLVSLTLLTATGCRTNVSGKGGVVTLNEQFSITVPAQSVLKQNAEKSIEIVLNRGAYFKRDVQLEIKVEGISVTPTSVLVKASDKPEVSLLIAVSREAALGEYRVTVTGTPTTGKPAVALFIVRVLAQ